MLTTLAALLVVAPTIHRQDDSRIAFVSDRDGNEEIYIMNIDGTEQKRLTTNGAKDVQPCFSPDGQQVLFASNRTGDWDIWVMNADGSNSRNLTNFKARQDTNPMWSVDPNRIAYVSNRRFYTMLPDGEMQEQHLDMQLPEDCQPSVMASGLRFAFRRADGHLFIKQGWDENRHIAIGYGVNGVPKQIFHPCFSADGAMVALDSGGPTAKLFIVDVEDSTCDPIIFQGYGWDPAFAKQNDSLVFTMPGTGKGTDIGIVDIDAVHKEKETPKPINLTNAEGNDSQACVWEPGGEAR